PHCNGPEQVHNARLAGIARPQPAFHRTESPPPKPCHPAFQWQSTPSLQYRTSNPGFHSRCNELRQIYTAEKKRFHNLNTLLRQSGRSAEPPRPKPDRRWFQRLWSPCPRCQTLNPVFHRYQDGLPKIRSNRRPYWKIPRKPASHRAELQQKLCWTWQGRLLQ